MNEQKEEQKKVTAEDIDKAIMETYREPEWYLGFEVGNSCGALVERHADAIAINAYPSRGFEVRGFEVKISRADLKHELDNGAKAEAVAKYCNYWFLVVPKGLTKDMQIPEPWGIIEYVDGKLRQKKPAKFMMNTVDFGFMCAFIRGRQRVDVANKSLQWQKALSEARECVKYENSAAAKEINEIKDKIELTKKETGIDLMSWSFEREEIKAIKIAKKLLEAQCEIGEIDHYIRRFNEGAAAVKKAYDYLAGIAGQKGGEK